MTFIVRQVVRFAYVDAAGIVFYPRYLEMVNAVVEDYFAEIIGVSFADMHVNRGVGVPTVKLDVEFKAPSRLGDLLEFQLCVTHVGRSSAHFAIDVHAAGEERLSARLVLVCMALEGARPTEWPADMRPHLQPEPSRLDGDAQGAARAASNRL